MRRQKEFKLTFDKANIGKKIVCLHHPGIISSAPPEKLRSTLLWFFM